MGRVKIILSIDPGLNGTGVVLWSADTWGRPIGEARFIPHHIKPSSKNWVENASNMCCTLDELCKQFYISKLIVEFPRVFQSAIGQAASNKGDILKLAFLIGGIRETFPDAEFIPITPNEWKGQLPKFETIRRLRKVIPKNRWVKSDHVWDAIGIALYAQGRF